MLGHATLPMDFASVPRVQRLKLHLRGRGLDLSGLAALLGVHFSAPGKWLINCTENLPSVRWWQLAALGVPLDCLPPGLY